MLTLGGFHLNIEVQFVSDSVLREHTRRSIRFIISSLNSMVCIAVGKKKKKPYMMLPWLQGLPGFISELVSAASDRSQAL